MTDHAIPGTRRVKDSADLARILDLPRRIWQEGIGGAYGTNDQLVETLSRLYGVENAQLRPVQAALCADACDFRGAIGNIRVGGGKTLASFLVAACMARYHEVIRPILLVPAKLREKTVIDHADLLRGGRSGKWLLPGLRVEGGPVIEGTIPDLTVEIWSYWHVRNRGDELLAEIRPDVVIGDEAHFLANKKSAGWRSFARYWVEHHPMCVWMSGTFSKRSIKDWAHLALTALRGGSPLPIDPAQLLSWAGVTDVRVDVPSQPGALVRLVHQADYGSLRADPIATVRRAVGRRVVETAGVVTVQDSGPGMALSIRHRHLTLRSDALAKGLKQLRELWTLPDGQPLCDAAQRWRHLRELSLGFFYRWVIRPPDAWLTARSAWCKFARARAEHSKRGIDTEARVFAACAAPTRIRHLVEVLQKSGRDPDDPTWAHGFLEHVWKDAGCPDDWIASDERYPRLTKKNARRAKIHALDHEASDAVSVFQAADLSYWRSIHQLPDPDRYWARWDAIRDSFTPETEPYWISDEVVVDAAEWLRQPGICWTSHVAVGQEIARVSGAPFFRKKGRDSSGASILDEAGTRGIICSEQACSEGFNLQPFSRSLILSMPSGKGSEQLLGRTHRDGQDADLVEAEVLVATREHLDAVDNAIGDAQGIQDTTCVPQKLLYADVQIGEPAEKGPCF